MAPEPQQKEFHARPRGICAAPKVSAFSQIGSQSVGFRMRNLKRQHPGAGGQSTSPADRLTGQPQERQHSAADGGTRDRLVPARGSARSRFPAMPERSGPSRRDKGRSDTRPTRNRQDNFSGGPAGAVLFSDAQRGFTSRMARQGKLGLVVFGAPRRFWRMKVRHPPTSITVLGG
jgi:hypothetical protein